MAFALEFGGDDLEHRLIGIGETAREEAVGLDVGQRGRIGAHADSLTVFGAASGRASLSTRARWRPPAKSVSRKRVMHARAISSPIRRAPSAMTLASLCSRANAADRDRKSTRLTSSP